MLRPALEKLIPVLARDAGIKLPEDADFVFNPLATMTPEEKEDLAGKITMRVAAALQAGLITPEEGRAEMAAAGRQNGIWSKLDETERRKPHEST